jgi:hypothetical protein
MSDTTILIVHVSVAVILLFATRFIKIEQIDLIDVYLWIWLWPFAVAIIGVGIGCLIIVTPLLYIGCLITGKSFKELMS